MTPAEVLDGEVHVPKMIRIAKGFGLPLEAVTQTIAILARKRSGKSYLLRKLAEQLFRAGLQIVDVDPKGDHWGMRSSADGRSPGLPILIVGGEHGDLPLEVGSGEMVAKLVVEERVSVLLDLSHFRKREIPVFMTAFLEALYRAKAREEFRTPIMVLVDEADAVAPQKPMPEEARMLGAIEDIVRRGGQRGIGCTLVTQRAAVLNKNVLTQAQVMIALRTIAPQDLKAMDEWIDVHGTREQRATLMESLPSLPRGDAWVWSPGWPTETGIFERIHVDRIETFDSGATPEPGQKPVVPKNRADVDLEALRRQMAETVERSKASDPALLRKRIADLERELARKPTVAEPLAAKIERIEVPVLKDGQVKRLEAAVERLATAQDRLAQAQQVVATEAGLLREAVARVRGAPPPAAPCPAPPPPPRRATPAPAVARTAPARPPAGAEPPEGLDKAQRAILAVLAQHPEGCAAGKLVLLAGYRWSGGFRNALSALRSASLIEGGNTGVMQITDAGLAALGAYDLLPTGRALLDYWLGHPSFGTCERAVLRTLAEHPRGLDAEGLIATLDGAYSWSGGFRNALSSLRTAGVLVGRNTEVMRLAEALLG